MSKKVIIAICVVAFLIFVGIVSSCSSDDTEGGDSTNEKSFTLECPTEMMAGDRIEITIKNVKIITGIFKPFRFIFITSLYK